jgi:hypothetical protein
MKRIKIYFAIITLTFGALSCSNEGLQVSDSALKQTAIDIAQTSGQLASGTSFAITGSSTDSTNASNNRPPRDGHERHGRHHGIIDGLHLLAPTDELLALVDAESAGDFRGLRISKSGGATITHYDASGQVVTLTISKEEGPHGCSFSGKQFPEYDSLLATIVKTEIDFGAGKTFKRDTVEITRAGKIVITRSADATTRTEVISFENYLVNGVTIEGTKTRISTYDPETGSATSNSTVQDGKITFADGVVATWNSEKSRTSQILVDETTGKPVSGTITTMVNTSVTEADGSVIYSHKTTAPLIENIACEGRRRGPVSGLIETIYREDTVVVDYGDGSCANKNILITYNGITTTRSIGG